MAKEMEGKSMIEQARANPWIISTVVLGILLIAVVATGFGAGVSVANEDQVSSNVLSFLNEQVDGGVTLSSIDQRGGYYDLVVLYQGRSIPIQTTLDGKYLISSLVSIAGEPAPSSDTSSDSSAPVDITLPAGANVRGSENAPVTVVEFSDFQCPFCEKFFTQTYSQIEKDYIDTGKVKFVYLHFPLSFHDQAQKAAEASQCAALQGKFWQMHDKMFENQASLSIDNYKLWAKQIGLNTAKFNTCLDSGETASVVAAHEAYGQSVGVSGTPGFFINGVPLSGAQPYSAFKQVIDAALANAAA